MATQSSPLDNTCCAAAFNHWDAWLDRTQYRLFSGGHWPMGRQRISDLRILGPGRLVRQPRLFDMACLADLALSTSVNLGKELALEGGRFDRSCVGRDKDQRATQRPTAGRSSVAAVCNAFLRYLAVGGNAQPARWSTTLILSFQLVKPSMADELLRLISPGGVTSETVFLGTAADWEAAS